MDTKLRKVLIEVPLHISGFWYVVKSSTIETTGSLGVGLLVKPALKVVYGEYRNCFGETIGVDVFDVEPVRRALEALNLRLPNTNIPNLKVFSKAKLGMGLGVSAALSIGIPLALSLITGRNTTICDVGKAAHIAEVKSLTGYGDVISEIFGKGLVIRLKPGAPCIGLVDSIPLPESMNIIALEVERMSTQTMMKTYGDRIREVGPKVYKEFLRNPSLERFLELAHEFSVRTGMLGKELEEKVKKLIKQEHLDILGFFKKKGLLVIVGNADANRIVTALSHEFGCKPLVLNPRNEGLGLVFY